jgi:hypothetical protein
MTMALTCALTLTLAAVSIASAGVTREKVYCGYHDIACDQSDGSNNYGFSNQGSVVVEHSLAATGDHVWFGDTYTNGRLWARAALGGPATDLDDESISSQYTDPTGDYGTELSGIAYDPAQKVIFFGDGNNNRVLAFHRNELGDSNSVDYTLPAQAPGPVTSGAATAGSGPGQFNSFQPTYGMAWNTFNQRLYVVDKWNARVQVFSYVYGDGGSIDPSIDYEGEISADWDSDFALPGDVAVDSTTGNVFVTDGEEDLVRVFDADGNQLDDIGSGTGGSSAEVNEVTVDAPNRLLYTVTSSYINVYSLYTGAKLGTFPSTDFKTQPGDSILDADVDPIGRKLYVVLNTNYTTAAPTNPTAAGYALDAPPTCTVAAPIAISVNQSVKIPTNCTDSDGAAIQEFHRDSPPASGSITPSADRTELTYNSGSTPGTIEARYRVITKNGLSPVYSQTINVTAPAAAPEVPVVRKTANLEPVSGDVQIKLPGTNTWIPLTQATLIPIGTIIDARNGKAHLTFANADGTTQDGIFWDGIFQITQGSGNKPIVTLKLRDDLVTVPKARSTSVFASVAANPFEAAIARKKGKKKNGLWGDAKGKYKTTGKGGSAAVRGTRWYVADYQNGSLFKVARGVVEIDPIRGKNFNLKAGKQFFIFYKRGK